MNTNSTSFAVVRTKLIGGIEGAKFDDFNSVGDCVSLQHINISHPIARIEVSSGWVVDGIAITYRLDAGSTVRIAHGSDFGIYANVIDLTATEIVMAVYGRAGYNSCYRRSMINQISFAIFDTELLSIRTVGPFGDPDNIEEGKPFYTTSPVALSGYAVDGAKTLGLSGLSFTKIIGNL
ncbi:hypothetical protein AX17_006527 [Amanita inopinata Kibby_2008]|nr:hypothetical protein AX17_006527 [Amanita inopinata Kibby_2008]